MPRYHRINWRESDTTDLERAVRNFNAKINRLLKKNPNNKNKLPEKVKVADIKKNINTRQDLKRELNKLKRFSKRGAEEFVKMPDNKYNLEITKWQRTEMKRMASRVNRERKKRLEKIEQLEATSRGEELGYKKTEVAMGSARYNSLEPINAFTPSMSYTDLRKKWETLFKESQSDYLTKSDTIWRNNYIDSIKKHFNANDPAVIEIVEHLENMDLEQWTMKAEAEVDIMEFTYPGDKKQEQQNLEVIKSTWGITSG